MAERLSPRRQALLIGGSAALLLALACISITGAAIVVDETGGVESAFITTSDGREQQLHQLWPGYFNTVPRLEGTIEVRCRDGTRKRWGYVTSGMRTRIRVLGDAPCARLVEA